MRRARDLGGTIFFKYKPVRLFLASKKNIAWLSLLTLLLSSQAWASASLPLLQQTRDGDLALSQPLTLRWLYKSDLTVNLTPATDGTRIYLPLAAGALVSLAVADGGLQWKSEVGGEISASPIADERGAYIASETVGGQNTARRANGAIRLLGKEGGVTLWMRTLETPLRKSLLMNQSTLFGVTTSGQVYAISKETGAIIWNTQIPSRLGSFPCMAGSRLYIGTDEGMLFSLNPQTGKILWRYRTRGAVRGRVAAANGLVSFGSADGYVYALNEADGRARWKHRTGAGVQSVTNTPAGLLVASLDNFVYLLSFNRGGRIWKHQLEGRPVAEPLTASDGVLFTSLSSDAGVVLDFHDGRQLNTLPIGEDNSTTASPIRAGDALLVTTRRGLLAFSRPNT